PENITNSNPAGNQQSAAGACATAGQDFSDLRQCLGGPVLGPTPGNVARHCRQHVGDRPGGLGLVIKLLAVVAHVLLDAVEEVNREALNKGYLAFSRSMNLCCA